MTLAPTVMTSRPVRLAIAAGLAVLVAGACPVIADAKTPTIVANVNDSGPGSLRAAIANSNRESGRQTITFNIPGAGVHTITPMSNLPQITAPVTIDGYSQAGAVEATSSAPATLKVVIDGRNTDRGLDVETGDSVVRGLNIQNVEDPYDLLPAIFVGNGSGNVIAGNEIGTDVSGSAARTNGIGVWVVGEPTDTLIGGTSPADRNVISANHYDVWLHAGPDNVVEGNRIGTSADGAHTVANPTSAAGDDYRGVELDGKGDTVRNNLIDNATIGVAVQTDNNTLQGNWIGIDASGGAAIPNAVGVKLIGGADNLIGGASAGQGNVISGNHAEGLEIETGSANRVEGNRIGTDPSGTAAIPNDSIGAGFAGGISVFSSGNTIGGSAAGASNLISNNDGDGIFVNSSATGNRLEGNTADRNDGDGIHIAATATTLTRNTADDNMAYGVEAVPGVIDGGGNTANGNRNALQCVNVFCK
jgi:parallel beta-helix repeat protein